MTLTSWLDPALSLRLILTLAHFLWQGAAIALIVALLTLSLRRASANARYWLSVAAILTMAACPIVTFSLLPPSAIPEVVEAATPSLPPTMASQAEAPAPAGSVDLSGPSPMQTPTEASPTAPETPWRLDWPKYAPRAVTAYGIGVLLFLARFLFALRGGQRLRRRSQPVDEPAILAALARQAKALRLAFTPAIAYCRNVVCPTVVGVLRPTILLPMSILTGLTVEQVEVLLTHELAHIRRYDHLINVLQRLIEAFLFFHPGLWYVSRRIRIEREHCCDDLVVATGTRSLDYATSLVRLAELAKASLAPNRVPATALAAADRPSSLRYRIGRLLGSTDHHSLRLSRAGLFSVVLMIGLALAATALLSAQTPLSKESALPARIQATHRATQKRWQDVRNLHIAATQHVYAWDQGKQEWLPTPEKTHIRAWYESLRAGRARMDFDPEICRWTNGARPYREERYTLAFDGKHTVRINHVYIGETYRSNKSEDHPGPDDRLTGSLGAYRSGVNWLPGVSPESQSSNPNANLAGLLRISESDTRFKWRINQEDVDGRRLTRLSFTTSTGGAGEDFLLDPDRAYAIVRQERFSKPPQGERKTYWLFQATAWQRLTPDLWFPTSWHIDERNSRTVFTADIIGFFLPDQADAVFSCKDITLGTPSSTPPRGPKLELTGQSVLSSQSPPPDHVPSTSQPASLPTRPKLNDALKRLEKSVLQEGSNNVSPLLEEIVGLKDPAAIPTIIGLIDADNSYRTIYGLGYFALTRLTGVKYDDQHHGPWWRKWWQANKHRYPPDVQALPIPDFPKTAKGKAFAANPPDPSTVILNPTLDDLIERLRRQLKAGADRPSIWNTAQRIAEMKDPRAIPRLIPVIEADNTHDTIYGIGYFGLGPLTGVAYSQDHNGQWWRQWWEQNKGRFDKDVKERRNPQSPDLVPPAPPAQGQRSSSTRHTPTNTAPISGQVCTPDGKPVLGATVLLCTSDSGGYILDGQPRSFGGALGTITDAKGRFGLPSSNGPYALAVTHDNGYAEVTGEEFAKSGQIVLRPWARVEGVLRIGSKPTAGEIVLLMYEPSFPYAPDAPRLHHECKSTTDHQGRFVLEKLPPGQHRVARAMIETDLPGGGYRTGFTQMVRVDLVPAETARVELGGQGRPVVGRLTMPKGYMGNVSLPFARRSLTPIRPAPQIPGLADFKANTPEANALRNAWYETDAGKAYERAHKWYSFKIDPDGAFRIDDIPAGRYELYVDALDQPEPDHHGPEKEIAWVLHTIEVPEIPGGRSDEPLDIGTVELKLPDKAKR